MTTYQKYLCDFDPDIPLSTENSSRSGGFISIGEAACIAVDRLCDRIVRRGGFSEPRPKTDVDFPDFPEISSDDRPVFDELAEVDEWL